MTGKTRGSHRQEKKQEERSQSAISSLGLPAPRGQHRPCPPSPKPDPRLGSPPPPTTAWLPLSSEEPPSRRGEAAGTCPAPAEALWVPGFLAHPPQHQSLGAPRAGAQTPRALHVRPPRWASSLRSSSSCPPAFVLVLPAFVLFLLELRPPCLWLAFHA